MNELGEKFISEMKKVIDILNNQKGFSALVVDANDPERAGRLQLFIYGVYPQELENRTDLLPWVKPLQSSDFKGGFSLPQKGQIVRVEFEGDDISFPRWTTKAYSKASLPKKLSDGVYGDTVVLFELSDSIWATMSRTTGQFEIQLNDVRIHTDKSGKITIDNHLAVSGSALLDVMPSEDASNLSKEALAELMSKAGGKLGAGILLRSSGEVTIEAPKFRTGGKPSLMSMVEPGINPLGGGAFNCIPVCPFVGMIHQGNEVTHLYSQAGETVRQLVEDDSE